MKVLHVTPAYEPAWSAGGVVRGRSLLCRALSQLGLQVCVYTTNTSGRAWLEVPVNRAVDVGGVEVFYFHTHMPRTLRHSRPLSLACRQTVSTFDLVHISAFWNHPGIVSGLEARRQGIPYVISTDGAMQEGALRQKRFKKWIYMRLFEMRNLRGAAAIRYVSELERDQSTHLDLDVPSFMVPSGLDFREFENLPDRQVARAEFEVPEDALAVGYLGRVDKRKALGVLIRAFAGIARRFPSAVLLLAGPDYGDEGKLRTLAEELGLAQQVRFLGYVAPEKRSTLLATLDLMTLTGYEGECFGYAAVEAAAAGVPLLMSENVGVGPTFEENGGGVLVPVGEAAIATALEKLLDAPGTLARMGETARQCARERYGLESIARKMRTAYQDVLTGTRSPECFWVDGVRR